MSNGLDQDQDPRSVGPDLGPNCLQRLSADNMLLLLSADLSNLTFSKNSFRNTIRVSNGLERLSADAKNHL